MSSIAAMTASTLNAQPNSAAAPAAGGGGQTLDFMKLLMTQMRNQNPMEPQSGTDFMAQVAQLSQVEGINKMNQNFADLLALQGLTQGANLIGKTVTYTKDAAGNKARGVVGSVAMASGKVQLVIGGQPINLSQVRGIEAGVRSTNNV
jgi:flagellar basal-body rod modification protein FlgD